jgi:hypothetical protein
MDSNGIPQFAASPGELAGLAVLLGSYIMVLDYQVTPSGILQKVALNGDRYSG